MKVCNMLSKKTGRPVANQFIVIDDNGYEYFQSYNSIICKMVRGIVYLDEYYWDYSKTTSKYRNIFLCKSTLEIKAKIASGEYKLVNLNK